MAAAITHNIDAVVKGLTTYQRVDLPKATRRTVNQFGYDFAKRYVPGYMKAVFQRPNNLTLRSLNYKVVSNYEVHFDFRQNLPKGNDPARYLYPVTKGLTGNQAYATKFTRYVHSAGIVPRNRYPIPVKDNLKKNSYGKVSQGEYTKTWSGLERVGGAGKTGRGFRYFSIPDGRNRGPASTVQGSLFNLGEGIYRIKGKSNLQLLFTYAKSQPRVPEIFDYYGFAEKTVKFRLGAMLSRNLR
jgi:hypothetical protein